MSTTFSKQKAHKKENATSDRFQISSRPSFVDGNMQRNATVLTVVCIMMLFTFNYTFPLHRKSSSASVEIYPNQTQHSTIPGRRETIVDRTKNMASNWESAIKRFKNSTQDFGKNIYDHVSSNIKQHINIISEEDLRNYEAMVIMKKYPYLDIKELENKYRSPKHVRQSLNMESNSISGNDPQLREYLEENPNVEITSRGLSGFAFPLEHSSSIVAAKIYPNNNEKTYDEGKVIKKSPPKDVLGSLKKDVKEFLEKRNIS